MTHAADSGIDQGTVIVLSGESRSLRRALRPIVWLTLEDVALDAVAEGGQLVARTSARQVAERLRVDPVVADRALRLLRNRGLLEMTPATGVDSRFGLIHYLLRPVPGLSVLSTAEAAGLMSTDDVDAPLGPRCQAAAASPGCVRR